MSVLTAPVTERRVRDYVPSLRHDRLLRNGALLTVSSGLTSLVGLAYWTVAAHSYSASVLGRNAAAISMMMFLAGMAELNLMSALVRFLPTAGRSTRSLVGIVYLTSIATALVSAAGFLLLLGWVAPNLRFLVENPFMTVGFLAATMAWTIFVLQDSVLTGLRQTWAVPVENAAYSLSKVGLVVILAPLLPIVGIFVSWTLALAITLVPVNIYLFKRAIPTHERNASPDARPAAGSEILRFATADYGGALCWLAAVNVLPILVLDVAGPKDVAYFSLAWVIAYSMYLVSGNMGISLVVETAADPSELAARGRDVTVQTLKMVVPLVLGLIVVASPLLGLFGATYSKESTTLLRLLALSAIPNVVTATAVSTARARSKAALGTAILAALCVSVFGLSALLLPVMGIVGVGVAWLASQCVAAAVILAIPALWPRRRTAAVAKPASASVEKERAGGAGSRSGTSLLKTWGTATLGWLHRTGVLTPVLWLVEKAVHPRRPESAGLLDQLLPDLLASMSPPPDLPSPESWTEIRVLPTLSALAVATVGPHHSPPAAVVKVAGSPAAADELRAYVGVIGDLRADPRLQEWDMVLPVILASHVDRAPAVVVERHIAAVDGRTLLRENSAVAERALRAALAATAELHDRTSRRAVIDEDLLTGWLDEPVAAVASLFDEASWQAAALRRIANELRGELLGQQVELGWTHGDYTPGNLLFAGDGSQVLGIVDWGGASPSGLAWSDPVILLLSTRMLRERRELGHVVNDLVRVNHLPSEERRLLGDYLPATSHRTLLLTCWLGHVAGNLRKAQYYQRRLLWRAANVEAVLREAGQ